ncbi:tetratricopeptide repeat protein [Alkalinema pantanalense CENA528]|uniref:tetratricopeptide repeat protein n=1 Tax=Alkalinema pantanalense TaxID=1620705 RepID=UPI003D6FE2C5
MDAGWVVAGSIVAFFGMGWGCPMKFDARDHSQVRAVGQAENAYLGDQHYHYVAQPIEVSGVGERPPSYERYWIDRSTYQTQLTDCLMRVPVTQIVAQGGFGKSSLAAWGYDRGYAQAGFDKRVWVSFRRSLLFDRFARFVLSELGRPVRDPQANEESLLRDLLWLLDDPDRARMLIVIDQVESGLAQSDWGWYEQFLQGWAAQGRRSAVLLTSRSRVLDLETIELGGMTEAEGLAFFDREGVTGEARSRLVALAAGHPLLLKLAAAWTTETYGARVDERAIDFFGKLFANYQGDPEASVSAIFDVIFEALPIELQELLLQVSVYRLPIDLEMAQAMRSEATAAELEVLESQGLLLRQDGRFVLHPLVEQFVRSRLTEEITAAAHEAAIAYYSAHYQEWDGSIESCRSELENFYHACELGQYGRAYAILDRCVGFLDLAGQWQLLLPLYERLTTEWVATEDTEAINLGWAWTRLGNLHYRLGRYREAISSYEKAQALFTSLHFRNGEAYSLIGLGAAYSSLGQYQRAIEFHQQSLEITRDICDRWGEAASLDRLGVTYSSLGQYQQAIEFRQQSLEIKRDIGDRDGEAASLIGLGNAYSSLGQYQRAIEFYQQSLEIKRDIGDRDGEAASLIGLGNAYSSLGQYQRAIEFYQQSLEIKRDIGDRNGEAASLGNLGNAYDSLGQYQRAIEFYQQSLEIKRDIGDRRGEASSLGGLGNIYRLLSHPKQSLEFHQASLEIARAVGAKDIEGGRLCDMGHVYIALGKYKQALEAYESALKILTEINRKQFIANTLGGIASVYALTGQPKQAMYYRHQMYKLWHEMELPPQATSLPPWVTSNLDSSDPNWAEDLIESENSIVWFNFSIIYILFIIRTATFPLITLQKKLKIKPIWFWVTVVIMIVFLIAWLKR